MTYDDPSPRCSPSAPSCLAPACAGDDLTSEQRRSPPPARPPSRRRQGTVRRSRGQSFPEAALVAAMYQQLLENAGYRSRPSSSTPATIYIGEFPERVDVVPEYVGGIVNFLNTDENGANAKPLSTRRRARSRSTPAQSLLEEAGHHPARPVRGDRHQRASSSPRSTPTPTASPSSPTSRARGRCWPRPPTARAALDCEGGLTDKYGIDVTEVLPLGYASDQTYQSVIDGESQLGETSTTDGTLEAQGLVLLEDDKQHPAGAEPRAGRVDRLPRRPPGRRGHAQRPDGGARQREPRWVCTVSVPSTASSRRDVGQGVPDLTAYRAEAADIDQI